MAVRPPKKSAKNLPKQKTVVDPEPEIDFEDETGSPPDVEDLVEEDGEVDLEVEPAKVERVNKNGLYVALKVVRVNPRGKLPDDSVHVGDVQYVGGPPFKIEDQEHAKELLRMKAIRPATEKDVRRSRSAA